MEHPIRKCDSTTSYFFCHKLSEINIVSKVMEKMKFKCIFPPPVKESKTVKKTDKNKLTETICHDCVTYLSDKQNEKDRYCITRKVAHTSSSLSVKHFKAIGCEQL